MNASVAELLLGLQDKESRSFLTELALIMVYFTGCQPSPRLTDQLLSPEYATVLRDSITAFF